MKPLYGTILIADDDADIRDILKDTLASLGARIITAADGQECLNRIETDAPDLVLLDIMLPDINGKEVCQRVRADDTLEQVKIICISGMVEQDKVADLRAAGADDFMQKPFTIDKLVDRACELLDMEKAVLA